MKIISLTLVGYTRFKLRQINYFHYEPKQKTQVILGTNGSGKSSLLKELSPLPANHAEFQSDGMKEIVIEHHHSLYKLKSVFSPSGHQYIFEKDGENLNKSFGITMYRDLVKQHFNYTQDIHDLITGQVRFDSMSISERRFYLNRMSDADFSYALKYFDRLAKQQRDLEGAVSLTQVRLSQEMQRLLTPEDEVALRQDVVSLTNELNQLLAHKEPRLTQRDAIQSKLDDDDRSLFQMEAKITAMAERLQDLAAYKNEETLQRHVQKLQVDLQVTQRNMQEHMKRIEKLQKTSEALKLGHHESLSELKKDIDEQQAKINQLKSQLYFTALVFPNVLEAISEMNANQDQLSQILEEFQQIALKEGRFNREDYHVAERHVHELTLRVKASENREHELFHQQKLMEEKKTKDAVECPSCHHQWVLNFHPDDLTRVVRLRQEVLQQLEVLKKDLEKKSAWKAALEKYFQLCRSFSMLIQRTPNLSPFWQQAPLLENNQPSKQLWNEWGFLRGDLEIHLEIQKLTRHLQENLSVFRMASESGTSDLTKARTEIQDEETALISSQNLYRQQQMQLNHLTSAMNEVSIMKGYLVEVDRIMRDRDRNYRALIRDACIGFLDEMIQNIKLQLSQKERILAQIETQRVVVKKLQDQVEEYKGDLELLKMAVKALSPKEGLIAQGMAAFINPFLTKMNEFIERIWLYPLELVPVLSEDDEGLDLNYRFSVQVNEDHVTPDVSKTSGSMKEIINLAFVAIGMKYLHLDDYPLFLDEFGKAMDPSHRLSAFQAIDYLIDHSDYPQIFLVSHYEQAHSGLANADTVVICDQNVPMAKNTIHNQHVVMR